MPGKGDFFSSLGDFFADVKKGIGVAVNDVVHAAGVIGHFLGGAAGTFIGLNAIDPLKAYFAAGGHLTVGGVTTVVVGGLLSGLVSLAAKSPDNIISTVAKDIPTGAIDKVAQSAGQAAQNIADKK